MRLGAIETEEGIDEYIVMPKLGKNTGTYGALALAIQAN